MTRNADGFFEVHDEKGRAGDLYKYRLDGIHHFPDPASRWQPNGVHGPSMVVDPSTYQWKDRGWVPAKVRDLVIYELHIGAFTPAGTYRGAIERLPYLSELGVTAIEIMPIADFPGERNWGYDGVCLYAPAHAYGHPDDLRALVDAAHAAGLTVILDVVYNHFGPDGNYLGAYIGDYLDEHKKTPWGGAIRYGDPAFVNLRKFVVANPGYWMREFHIDGFRLDATHAILDESSRHILAELTASIHAAGGFAIAEDSRNETRVLLPEAEGGLGFDAVWADDFHHTARVANTRENESYLGDFDGSIEELTETLRHGWYYCGQISPRRGSRRGTECRHLAPDKFVHCISNHDQIGNRAMGDRLGAVISRKAYLASSALLCLSPYVPLIFMGQEWNARTPFLFFTNHNAELGKLVVEGRRMEFKDFAAFSDPKALEAIPNPQEPGTFASSRIDWAELQKPEQKQVLALYKACLLIRRSAPAFHVHKRDAMQIEKLAMGAAALRLKEKTGDWLLLFDLAGGHEGSFEGEWICRNGAQMEWRIIFSTNEERFGGDGQPLVDLEKHRVNLSAPGVVLLHEAGIA